MASERNDEMNYFFSLPKVYPAIYDVPATKERKGKDLYLSV